MNDATGQFNGHLINGATVSNNHLQLSSTSQQYLKIDSLDIISAGVSFTCWFYLSSSPGICARIFDFGNGQNVDNMLIAVNCGPMITADNHVGSSNYRQQYTGTLTTNVWYHVAWVVDPVLAKGTLYLNGAVVDTGSSPYPSTVTRTLNYLGKGNWATDPYFDGNLADFRMYPRVLTASEISSIFSAGVP